MSAYSDAMENILISKIEKKIFSKMVSNRLILELERWFLESDNNNYRTIKYREILIKEVSRMKCVEMKIIEQKQFVC